MVLKLPFQAILFLTFSLLLSGGLSTVSAQQFLILEKPGKVINYKYQVGDNIIVHTKGEKKFIHGSINRMNDSLLWIDYTNLIKIGDIDNVVRVRKLCLFMTELTIKGAIGVFSISTINNLITSTSPILNSGALYISGAALTTGALFYLLRNKNHKMGTKWRLKVIDFTPLQFENKSGTK